MATQEQRYRLPSEAKHKHMAVIHSIWTVAQLLRVVGKDTGLS